MMMQSNAEPLPTPQSFEDGCATIGLSLEAGERQQLGRFLALLLETNKRFNLTAIREPEAAWLRHVLDSLSLIPFLQGADRVIDVGSGGGLPGLPLAITCPDVKFTLLEATGKKAKFIESAATKLGLGNVSVVNDRAENAGRDGAHRQKYDVAIARAVGPMRVLLEYTLPLTKTGGRVLAMKGARVVDELDECSDALMLLGGGAVEVYEALPGLEDDAVIVEVTKDRATPREYPRRPGEPKSKPL